MVALTQGLLLHDRAEFARGFAVEALEFDVVYRVWLEVAYHVRTGVFSVDCGSEVVAGAASGDVVDEEAVHRCVR